MTQETDFDPKDRTPFQLEVDVPKLITSVNLFDGINFEDLMLDKEKLTNKGVLKFKVYKWGSLKTLLTQSVKLYWQAPEVSEE